MFLTSLEKIDVTFKRVLHFKMNNYIIEKIIGNGGFGVVFAAKRIADNLPVAIKQIKKQKLLVGQNLQTMIEFQ